MIVISAARDVDSIRSALHGGVLHYLVKPFDRRDVRAAAAATTPPYGASWPSLDEAGQGDVDRMFGLPRGTAQPVATPKGISPETLELVREALSASGPDGLSATECSERTGLARVSARRYLEHLVSIGTAEMRPRYGAAGRPERRYRVR